MTAELAELSELHLAYENAVSPAEDEADNLSHAVGQYVMARGYAGRSAFPVAEMTLRDRLAALLSDVDPNGLQPTNAALAVITAVIESTDLTDGEWSEDGAPTTNRYAWDAERFLNSRRHSVWARS